MIYSRLKGFTGKAEELWKAIQRVNMFGAWMSSYTVGEPQQQAADIWAYSPGHKGEHNQPKYIEAQIALSFFVDRAMKQSHGAHWFTYLDRNQILVNTGQLSILEDQ